MATTTTITTTTTEIETEPAGDQCVVLTGVDWKGYSAVLRARGERRVPRIVYLDGELFFMSPDFSHEHLAEKLGLFLTNVAVELDIRFVMSGSTTFRRKKKNGGVEADKSFYFANAARITGKTKLHLRQDPPPDLVIEAVNTHDADASVEVWRRFGVPEVWVCDASSLQILALQPDGNYAESKTGVAFPYLTAAEIFEWVTRPTGGNDTAWFKELRQWVRDVLRPRFLNVGNEPGGA